MACVGENDTEKRCKEKDGGVDAAKVRKVQHKTGRPTVSWKKQTS
jgi:hypothetical protein